MAAPNTVTVRRPTAVISGGEATDSITLAWAFPIGSVVTGAPNAKYSVHPSGGAKISSPTAKELIAKIAAAQAAMFEQPKEVQVAVNDGGEGSLIFKGYDTGPHHSIYFGGVANGKTIVNRCSRLFFLNTSIYQPPFSSGQNTGQNKKPYAESLNKLEAAENPCDALKIVLQELIKNFEQAQGQYAQTTAHKIRLKIHEYNKKILEEEWYPILEASTESSIKSFSSIMSNVVLKMPFYDYIASVYLSGSDDFSVLISQFESAFMMRFLPSMDGSTPGKFIPMSKLVEDAESKEVNITSLSLTPGPRQFLITTGVAMRGLPSTDKPYAQSLRPSGVDAVTWPEELPPTGQTKVVQMPPWLPSDIQPTKVDNKGLDLNAQANLKAILALYDVSVGLAEDVVAQICTDIARLTYINVSLQNSSASIVSPLDLSWELGKRYEVKQAGGSALFAGFLSNIQHVVSSNPSSPQAYTQLTFSHVEANGFTLPNKS